MKNRIFTVVAALAATVGTQSCNTPEGHSWSPDAGLQFTISDNYDFNLSALGYTASGAVDYSSTEIRVGGLRTSQGETRRIKHEFAGVFIGNPEFDGQDGSEWGGGGRIYMDTGKDLIPYVSFYSTSTDLDLPGFSTVPQLGLRFGGGVEYLISDGVQFDLGLDFLLPLIEGSIEGVIDMDVSGLAIRAGISVGF